MSFALAHHLGPGTLPDVNSDGEIFEDRPTHLLSIPASSQLPLVHFETGSVLDVSVAGSNPEHLAYEGTANGYAYRDPADYRYGQDLSAHRRGYDARVPGCPLSLTLTQSQSLNDRGGMLEEPLPRFRAYGTIYTDDVRMKLGDGIRRQCFNCRTTDTKTWRRSKLSPGKMVCNKCGLFERSHSVPRPEVFQPKRRSRLASDSVRQSWNLHLPDVEGSRHYNDHLPVMPFTHPSLNAFNPGEGGAITSLDATWMTRNTPVPDVSSHSSPVSTRPIAISTPTLFRTDFPLPTSYSTQEPASTRYLGHGHHPM